MDLEQNGIMLYEYDYDKPELSEESLAHFGVLGMKWGIRKKPNSSGLSRHKKKKLKKRRIKNLKKARKIREKKRAQAQEVQKTKDEIIKSKDISQMLKNVDKFSNQEINDMLTRLDTESRLRERVAKESVKNQSRGEKAANFVKSNVSAGLKAGSSTLLKTVSENALEIGVKALAKSMASANNEETIEKLFKQKKK